MKTRLILNPNSGHNRTDKKIQPALESFITAHPSLHAQLVLTQRPVHATQLAREALAEGCTHLVAIGGDGTMNEIATALLGATHATLCLVPRGSGNGLARHLRIPLNLENALALIANPLARRTAIDHGTVNNSPFFNVAGHGFDALIAHRFANLTQRGFLAYIRETLYALRTYKPAQLSVTTPTETFTARPWIASIANSTQYGNNARIAPCALSDDGQLDLVLLSPRHLLDHVATALRLFLGNLHHSPVARTVRASHFTLTREETAPVHLDGEPIIAPRTLEIQAHRQSLHVLTPP